MITPTAERNALTQQEKHEPHSQPSTTIPNPRTHFDDTSTERPTQTKQTSPLLECNPDSKQPRKTGRSSDRSSNPLNPNNLQEVHQTIQTTEVADTTKKIVIRRTNPRSNHRAFVRDHWKHNRRTGKAELNRVAIDRSRNQSSEYSGKRSEKDKNR